MNNRESPLLRVINLQTHFFTSEGIVRAVDGATFDIYSGRTTGLVGESGCGKSVTAMSILRIVQKPGRIVGGEICLKRAVNHGEPDEIDLTTLKATGKQIRDIRGREIALIFQEPMSSLSPVHTIGDQIVEAIRLHSDMSKDEALHRAIELLTSVGIPRAEQRVASYSFQLSGGLRQRAAIAMALSCNPQFLIADEPTTALDVTTQAQILELMRSIQEEHKMAIMLITHDLGVIAEMCDDVVVMYLGSVVEQGPVVDIFHNPKHPYTKALLASIPSVTSTPRIQLPTIVGSIPHPYDRPAGCPFHPRCPERLPDICDRRQPVSVMAGDDHYVACLRYKG